MNAGLLRGQRVRRILRRRRQRHTNDEILDFSLVDAHDPGALAGGCLLAGGASQLAELAVAAVAPAAIRWRSSSGLRRRARR